MNTDTTTSLYDSLFKVCPKSTTTKEKEDIIKIIQNITQKKELNKIAAQISKSLSSTFKGRWSVWVIEKGANFGGCHASMKNANQEYVYFKLDLDHCRIAFYKVSA